MTQPTNPSSAGSVVVRTLSERELSFIRRMRAEGRVPRPPVSQEEVQASMERAWAMSLEEAEEFLRQRATSRQAQALPPAEPSTPFQGEALPQVPQMDPAQELSAHADQIVQQVTGGQPPPQAPM